jgi:hypothetical protein
MVEMGRIAALVGNRSRAEAQYRQAIQLCEADRDRLCVADARKGLDRR